MVSEVRGGQAITYGYDGFNRLTTITNAAGTTTYIYSDGYDRVQKRLPNGKSIIYFGDLAELNELGEWTDYLFLGARRVATVQGGAMYYNVSDHLGSASLELDGSGAVVQKLDYLPFGGERVNVKTGSFDTRFTFTDQEKDESGLMYYGARYYHTGIGRFTQQDPVVIQNVARKEFKLALQNPQLLNAYTYVANNPLKFIDDNGEVPRVFYNIRQGVGFWVGGQGYYYSAQGAYAIQDFLNDAADYNAQQGDISGKVGAVVTKGAAEVFERAGKVLDPNVDSTGERAMATVMLSLDLASGGEGKAASKAVQAAEKTSEATKVVITKTAQKIDPLARKASEVIRTKQVGRIMREFPSELRNKTLGEIQKLTKAGGTIAQKAKKAWKLLTSGEYKR